MKVEKILETNAFEKYMAKTLPEDQSLVYTPDISPRTGRGQIRKVERSTTERRKYVSIDGIFNVFGHEVSSRKGDLVCEFEGQSVIYIYGKENYDILEGCIRKFETLYNKEIKVNLIETI